MTPTLDGLVAMDGLLEAEAGQTLLAALEPLARPVKAQDARSGSQRRADALTELARRALEGGRLPRAGGVRPQLAVLVDLDTLHGRPEAVGGDTGWAGLLAPAPCRRLAGDGAITRVLVSRHPSHHAYGPGTTGQDPGGQDDPGEDQGDPGLTARLEAALTRLPPRLGGRPANPWTGAGPPGWSAPANAPPWPCATAAAWSPTAPAPWPGARATI